MTSTSTSTTDDAIRAFRLDVPDAVLADLHDRLDQSRWTDDSVPLGWSAGVPVGYLNDLARHGRPLPRHGGSQLVSEIRRFFRGLR